MREKILSCVREKKIKFCEKRILSHVREKNVKLWLCDFDHLGLAILANFPNLVNLLNLVLGIFANFTNPLRSDCYPKTRKHLTETKTFIKM